MNLHLPPMGLHIVRNWMEIMGRVSNEYCCKAGIDQNLNHILVDISGILMYIFRNVVQYKLSMTLRRA